MVAVGLLASVVAAFFVRKEFFFTPEMLEGLPKGIVNATEGGMRQDLLHDMGVLPCMSGEVGGRQAGGDGVDRDASFAQICGQYQCEVVDGSFSHRVGSHLQGKGPPYYLYLH